MGALVLLPLLAAFGFAIQPPGQFHGNEPVARDGERWLALRVDGNDAALVPTRLRLRTVFDEISDQPGGPATGRMVESPLDDKVVVFLQGAPLVAGTVDTARPHRADGDQRQPLDYSIQFGDAHYRVVGACAPAATPVDGTHQPFDCRIVLRDGRGREQVLVRMDGYADTRTAAPWLGDDASPSLLFAGDLDRDGKLDLLFDTTDHYNVSRPTLFLSSQAKPGELLHRVAQYESVGC